MADTTPGIPGSEPAHSAFRVLAALADLGEATAAAIAQHAGLAYSTVTPKLRAWETSGHAEKYRHAATNQTLWRLTPAGRAATGTQGQDHAPPTDTEAPQTSDDADRATTSPPTEPAPFDRPTTEPDTNPPHTGTECAEGPDLAAAQPVPPPITAADADPQPVEPAHDSSSDDAMPHDSGDDAAASNDSGAETPPPVAKRKRPAGALEASVLAILHHRPDETFTVNDLRKLVDNADHGTGYPAASAGAIANALTKLTGKGHIDTVQEKPATFQAAPTTD
ncbi:hypothetical protein AB0C29_07145 [Actinoplanes sp. NPDC048791]|uniref:hypothetical protein n=1 Tax=Actinoplanes sp. NPDC048791 TaxID=3154623 RepID=UPI0033EB7FC7